MSIFNTIKPSEKTWNRWANRVFQTVWYSIRWIWRKPKSYTEIVQRSPRILNQIKVAEFIANLFGVRVLYAWLGDSNGEVFRNPKDMREFPGIALNLSIAAMRCDNWVNFLNHTVAGQKVLAFLQELNRDPEADTIWNIGGNHVLQVNQMRTLRPSFKQLVNLTPNAWFINLPSILYPGKGHMVREANFVIRDQAGEKVIDVHTPFTIPGTDNPLPGVQTDGIHYGPKARKVILDALPSIVDHGE